MAGLRPSRATIKPLLTLRDYFFNPGRTYDGRSMNLIMLLIYLCKRPYFKETVL